MLFCVLCGFFTQCIQVTSKFPVLAFLLALFLSSSHKQKERATSTSSQWKTCTVFYKCFLLDTFLRARQAKAIRPTTVIVTVLMLMFNINESCWRLLQRLRIVCSKKTIENYVRSSQKKITGADNLLIYTYDNCDFKKHVTNVWSTHRTSMIHVISRCVLLQLLGCL